MIKILDNFFDKDDYDKIIYHVKNKIYFTPRFFNGTTEKTKNNYYGDRFALKNDNILHSCFIKQAEKKFKLKIHKTFDDGIDLRNLDKFDPHIDGDSISNILVMLDGPIGVTTGTVFYTDNQLDMHVGFRPNRAIMFPSNLLHSAHKSDTENLKRYTATLFLVEYEELIK